MNACVRVLGEREKGELATKLYISSLGIGFYDYVHTADREIFKLKIIRGYFHSFVWSAKFFLTDDGYNVDEHLESLIYYQVSLAVCSHWLDIYLEGGEGGEGVDLCTHSYIIPSLSFFFSSHV